MTCEQAQPFLSAYVDRELDITKSLETEDHVRQCTRCSARLQQYEALRSALNAASLAFVPPAGLERRVRKAVRRETKPRVLFTLAPWRWAAVPMAATLAAALTWSVAMHRAGTTGEIWSWRSWYPAKSAR